METDGHVAFVAASNKDTIINRLVTENNNFLFVGFPFTFVASDEHKECAYTSILGPTNTPFPLHILTNCQLPPTRRIAA